MILFLDFQDGERTANNEAFRDVAETIWSLAKDKSKLIGIGVNCLDPKVSGTI